MANREVRFIAVDELDVDDAEAAQGRLRRRILQAFVRRAILLTAIAKIHVLTGIRLVPILDSAVRDRPKPKTGETK